MTHEIFYVTISLSNVGILLHFSGPSWSFSLCDMKMLPMALSWYKTSKWLHFSVTFRIPVRHIIIQCIPFSSLSAFVFSLVCSLPFFVILLLWVVFFLFYTSGCSTHESLIMVICYEGIVMFALSLPPVWHT